MKSLPAFSPLLLIALFAVAGLAQAPTPSPAIEISKPEKALTTKDLEQKAKAAKFSHLAIKYDKFKDVSVVSTKPQNLIGGMESFAVMAVEGSGRRSSSGLPTVLVMSLLTSNRGDGLFKTPDKFYLTFESNSKGWVFLKGDKNLYILCGDRRMEFHPVASDADVYYGSVAEALGFELSRVEVENIVGCKNSEMRLGDTIPRKWKDDYSQRFHELLEITKLELVK